MPAGLESLPSLSLLLSFFLISTALLEQNSQCSWSQQFSWGQGWVSGVEQNTQKGPFYIFRDTDCIFPFPLGSVTSLSTPTSSAWRAKKVGERCEKAEPSAWRRTGIQALPDELCKHCHGVLRSCHVLLHPQPLSWAPSHIRRGWRGVWNTDQGKLMTCQTSRDRQRFPPLLQEWRVGDKLWG